METTRLLARSHLNRMTWEWRATNSLNRLDSPTSTTTTTTSWVFPLESLRAAHSHHQRNLPRRRRRRRRRRHRSRLRPCNSHNHQGDCKACPKQRFNRHGRPHLKLLNSRHDRCCSQLDSSHEGEPRGAERGRADCKRHRGLGRLTRSLGQIHH